MVASWATTPRWPTGRSRWPTSASWSADTVEYPIQVNGKVRSRVTVPADAGQDAVTAAALADERIVAALAGAEPRKVIVVPGRLVNVVR